MHRHDNVYEITVTNRADHTRAGIGGGLQGYIGRFDHIERFSQEAHIEGNQNRRPFNRLLTIDH